MGVLGAALLVGVHGSVSGVVRSVWYVVRPVWRKENFLVFGRLLYGPYEGLYGPYVVGFRGRVEGCDGFGLCGGAMDGSAKERREIMEK